MVTTINYQHVSTKMLHSPCDILVSTYKETSTSDLPQEFELMYYLVSWCSAVQCSERCSEDLGRCIQWSLTQSWTTDIWSEWPQPTIDLNSFDGFDTNFDAIEMNFYIMRCLSKYHRTTKNQETLSLMILMQSLFIFLKVKRLTEGRRS